MALAFEWQRWSAGLWRNQISKEGGQREKDLKNRLYSEAHTVMTAVENILEYNPPSLNQGRHCSWPNYRFLHLLYLALCLSSSLSTILLSFSLELTFHISHLFQSLCNSFYFLLSSPVIFPVYNGSNSCLILSFILPPSLPTFVTFTFSPYSFCHC